MPSKKLERFYIWAIKTIIFIIPFLSLYVATSMLFPFITGKNFVFRILTELATVLWFGLMVLSKEYRLKNSTILLLVLAFTFVVGLADLSGLNPYNSLWSSYERMEGYLTILHLCLYFMIIKSVFKTKKDWIILLNIFALVGVVVSFSGLLQKLGYFRIAGDNIVGTIGNSAFLAAYLLLASFLNMILIINTKRVWLKTVYLAVILLHLLIIYYTAIRGPILAVVIGIISFSLFYIFGKTVTPRDKLFRKIAISVISGILILSIGFFAVRDTAFIKQDKTFSRIASISPSDPTTQFRLIIWGMAWEGIKERPILGWGQENFIIVYSKHYNPKLFRLETWADRAHNIILDWLVNAGFLGLFSYLSIFVAVLYGLWSAHKGRLISRAEAFTVTAALIVYFFQNLFVFDTINTYIVFFALLAYVDTLESRAGGHKSHGAEAPKSPEFFRLKIKSVTVTALVLIIFSFAGYFINYKPIKQSQLTQRIIISFPNYRSFSTVLDDFNRALAYRTFGDRDVRLSMFHIASKILDLRLFEQSALKFLEATAVELEKQVAANPNNLGYLTAIVDFLNKIAAYAPSFIGKAEIYIKECLRLSPESQWVYFSLAENYVLKKDYENAFIAMKKAVALAPEKEESQFKMALTAILTSREDLANSALENVKKIRASKDSDVAGGKKPVFPIDELLKLTQISMSVENFSLALRFYKEIIAISPQEAKYHFEIANIYLALGDKVNAIKEAKKAEEIDPLNYKKNVEEFIKTVKKKGSSPTL